MKDPTNWDAETVLSAWCAEIDGWRTARAVCIRAESLASIGARTLFDALAKVAIDERGNLSPRKLGRWLGGIRQTHFHGFDVQLHEGGTATGQWLVTKWGVPPPSRPNVVDANYDRGFNDGLEAAAQYLGTQYGTDLSSVIDHLRSLKSQ